MEQYILPRSGKRSLSFIGECLASGDTRATKGPRSVRWWDVAVYRTESGRYVLTMRWNTRWQGEQDHDAAIVAASLGGVADELEQADPLAHLIGFPMSGDGKYAARQRHVETVLRQAWAQQVRDVLATLGVSENADDDGAPPCPVNT